MGLQQNTDVIVRAYLICQKSMILLEKEHGPSIKMYESEDGYTWTFSDRTVVKMNKNGEIVFH